MLGPFDITPAGDENVLADAVGSVGPISVNVDASDIHFQLYK